MNSKILEASNNSPFRLPLNKLNLAKNFMVVGALFPLATNECQHPMEQSLIYLEHRHTAACRVPLQPHLS